MRRPNAPRFKVEIRRSRRNFRRPQDEGNEKTIDPIVDEFPSVDVNDDFDEEIRRAEAKLFGRLSASQRPVIPSRIEMKQRVIPRKVPGDPFSRDDIFRKAAPEAAKVEEAPAAPVRRILPNLLAPVDPVQQKFEDMRAPRRNSRIGKIFKTERTQKPRVRAEQPQLPLFATKTQPERRTRPRPELAEPRVKAVPVVPVVANSIIAPLGTEIPPYRPRSMLYNKWIGKRLKQDAKHFPQTADRALRAGERWKRRLPISTW